MSKLVFACLALTAYQSVISADILCPDQRSSCPDATTCCQLPTQQWGCCPMQSAVCCKDGLHCCPERTKCNLEQMSCDKQSASGRVQRWSWFSVVAAIPAEQLRDDVICPDGKKKCPSENTCCKMGNPPDWGCCQFPHAVCCPDHVHCCPHGTECNGSECTQTGVRNHRSHRGISAVDIRCDDGSYCDHKSTCCKMENGLFGCCPVTNAVCCGDGLHCCDSGSECEARTGKCIRQTAAFGSVMRNGRKWMKKYQAVLKSPIICPDQQSECPENTTCCQLESGDYGCCPMPSAVCCEDKIHCCPQGTTCDLVHQKCSQGSGSVRWYRKTKAYPRNDIVCPDQKSRCPSGSTCCPLDDSSYGCCPLPQAVCCEDHLHCCPTGTTCNVEEEECISARGMRTPWYMKFKPKQH